MAVAIKTPVVITNTQTKTVASNTPEADNQASDATQRWQFFEPREETAEILQKFIEGVPLGEPFDRIRRAISEAHSFAA